MSLSDTCKKEWIIQILLYSYLGIKKYEKDEDFKDDDAYEIVHFRDAFLYNFITYINYFIKLYKIDSINNESK